MTSPAHAKAFRILNPKLIRKNSLIGAFDLEMPSGLIIRGVMLMESHGGRWVSLPSKPYQKPDGTQSWIPFADFTSGEVKERFNSQVLPIAEAAFELSGAQ